MAGFQRVGAVLKLKSHGPLDCYVHQPGRLSDHLARD